MYIYPGKYVPQTLRYQFVELVKSLKYFSVTHPTLPSNVKAKVGRGEVQG